MAQTTAGQIGRKVRQRAARSQTVSLTGDVLSALSVRTNSNSAMSFHIRMASNECNDNTAVQFDVQYARGHSATVARRIFDPKVMVRIHLASIWTLRQRAFISRI